MVTVKNVTFSAKTQLWCGAIVVVMMMVIEVAALNGPNVCMVKQKYNITKRVKYRAPMSVRTYEWCMSIPPRCSKWSTEMRDLTRLETEERTAEVAVCCPGYKMRDVSCVPICPNGRTGHGCSQDCPQGKWGPNCVNECPPCSEYGTCSPFTGECSCQEGWQGESCESRMSSTTSTTTTATAMVEELLTKKTATKPTPPLTSTIPSTALPALVENTIATTSRTSILGIITTASRPSLLETTTTAKPAVKDLIETNSNPGTTVKKIIVINENVPETNSLINKTKLEGTSMKTVISSNTSSLATTSTLATAKESFLKTPTMTTDQDVAKETTLKTLTTTADLTNEKETAVKTTTIIPENITSTLIVTSSIKASTTRAPTQSLTTENVLSTTPMKNTYTDKTDKNQESTTTESFTLLTSTVIYNNETLKTQLFKPVTEATHILKSNSIYNKTEPYETRKQMKEVHVEIKTTPIRIIRTNESLSTAISQRTTGVHKFTNSPITTSPHVTTTSEATTKIETTRRPDATIRYFPTTIKFKPKEIWIRPAQKGETLVDTKKTNHDLHTRHRATNNVPANTTPKTIIVSIIPTSVSYSTFKKIAFTTASVTSQTTNMAIRSNKSTEHGFTKPMSVVTTTLAPLTSIFSTSSVSVKNSTKSAILKSLNATKSNPLLHKVTRTFSTLSNTTTIWMNKTTHHNETKSMTGHHNLNSSISVTQIVSSTNSILTTHKPDVTKERLKDVTRQERVTKNPFTKIVTPSQNVTIITVSGKNNTVKSKTVVKDVEKTNATKTKDINAKTNKLTTESPDDEEIFHILTEPEHITAVMEGKGKERASVDLISVISIAGGIMMAVITVAVVIVMIERCKRPRYEDVRKMNDIHMQVMIDNSDVPPPYVRSIFHTPLPDPPTSEKCHYQPISTLDRNLKQFMRPVVVQTISPIMLENFRGILECHYDHLPRRSHDFEARHKHCSIPPSIDDVDELTRLRPCSIAESTIDALKCEAQLDVLDSTTSEPLYAEIPCWRPPSEHAIEIINLNGEAVTEL